jgi:multidrug efflux pump subunit AcrA (membrane-fusion protein)
MTTKIRRRRKKWLGKLLFAGVILSLAVVAWRSVRKSNQHVIPPNAYYEVKRGDLLISVVEEGALKAMNEVVIRNSLVGESRILQLAPEGAHVTKGDLLVELDSSLVREKLNEQELAYQDNLFVFQQAQENLKIQKSLIESRIKDGELQVELAQADLGQYRDGDAPNQVKMGEAQKGLIEEAVRIAAERYARTQELHKNKNATRSELEADSLGLTRNRLALEQTLEDLRILKKFDQPNTIRMLESNVQQAKDELERLKQRSAAELAQAEADLKTSEKALAVMDAGIKQQRRQLENAKIYAPQDGLVVYASMSPFSGRGEGRGGDLRSPQLRSSPYGNMFESDGRFRRGGGGERGGGGGRRGGSGSGGGSGSRGGGSMASGSAGPSALPASSGQGASSGSSGVGAASTSSGQAASTGSGSQSSLGGGGSSGTAAGGSSSGRGGSGSSSGRGGSSGGGGAPMISYVSVRQNSSAGRSGSGSSGSSSSLGSSSSGMSGSSGMTGSSGSGGQGSYSTEGSQSGSRSRNSSYSFDEGMFFSGSTVIEEGAVVRQRQELIKLPDVSRMLVEVKVQESRVRQVFPGMQAFVRVETLPGLRFKGSVRKVGLLPDTQSSWMNPDNKVYATEVLIDDELPELKPGVSARAEIIITNLPKVLSVPIQAVTVFRGEHVCFAKRGRLAVPVPVTTGWFNDRFIEIKTGLKEGDRVLLAPVSDDEDFETEYPEASTNQVEPAGSDPNSARNGSVPNEVRTQEMNPTAPAPAPAQAPAARRPFDAERGDGPSLEGRGSSEGGRGRRGGGGRGDDPEAQRRREEFMKLSPEEREERMREFRGGRGEGRGRRPTNSEPQAPSENAKP